MSLQVWHNKDISLFKGHWKLIMNPQNGLDDVICAYERMWLSSSTTEQLRISDFIHGLFISWWRGFIVRIPYNTFVVYDRYCWVFFNFSYQFQIRTKHNCFHKGFQNISFYVKSFLEFVCIASNKFMHVRIKKNTKSIIFKTLMSSLKDFQNLS